MPKIKLSQDHVDASNNVYDEGWCVLEVEELTEKKDRDGADLFVYSCKITEAIDEQMKRFIGRKAFINVSEKAFGFAIPFFRACGAVIPEKISEEGIDLEMKFCLKKKVRAHNAPKKDKNGVLRNNWDQFLRVE